jgi:hypothetical protein
MRDVDQVRPILPLMVTLGIVGKDNKMILWSKHKYAKGVLQ